MSVATAALERRSPREWGLLALAAGLSLLAHCAGAAGASRVEPPEHDGPVWVEMTVDVREPPPPEPVAEPEPPPPEPEPPPPEPEPTPAPPPVPEEVEFTPEPAPPPDAPPPPPEAKPVPRQVQGLSNESFLKGGNTNLAANVGNTTATRATEEKLDLDEAPAEYVTVPYTSVSKPPKVRYKPRLEIPESIVEAELEGRVEVALTIDADGRVAEARVVATFHPDAATACIASMKKSRWKAGTKDGTPVITKNVPYSCRFEMAVD